MSRRPAVIVDIDGTIADKGDRSPYDYSKVSEDTVIEPIRELVWFFEELGFEILTVSGRSNECFVSTDEWLHENEMSGTRLFMRKAGDYRPDTVIKAEIYHEHIEPYYDVKYILDDRNKVVKMWRDLGLTVLQVADGDF